MKNTMLQKKLISYTKNYLFYKNVHADDINFRDSLKMSKVNMEDMAGQVRTSLAENPETWNKINGLLKIVEENLYSKIRSEHDLGLTAVAELEKLVDGE